ncbi:permease of the major facilitator superfamily [Cenarchaeum symbiosum A]|uniref:Permease of the major facilitator superfamily n=1 Tax=Cenarchaeum symbiosum (strain A) TaxID=414004 RepID=A0RU05_CENSY|nr:permease of the major facilitator superfamily [Cenarchaeum symbiosum A]
MKTTLLLVNAVALLVGISYGMHGPSLPIFAKNVIGASYSDLGLIGLGNFIPYMFIPLFVGLLLDRYNRGHLLSIGVVLNSASIYLLSIAQTVPEVAVYRVMTGAAHAFFWPPCVRIISSVSTGRERVLNVGRFTGFFIGGVTMGPLLGSVLLENVDVTYRALFQITAFVLAAAIIASISLSRRHARDSATGLATPAASVSIHTPHFTLSAVKAMARFPEVILVLVYCTASFGVILAIFPAYLDDNLLTGTEIGILYFVFGLSRITALIMVGRLARRTGHTLVASTVSLVIGLGLAYVAGITGGGLFLFAASLLIMGFGFSVLFPLALEVVLSRTHKKITGSMIGAYETTIGIGWVTGPIIVGVISEFYGGDLPYLVLCILGAGVAVLSAARRHRLEPARSPGGASLHGAPPSGLDTPS